MAKKKKQDEVETRSCGCLRAGILIDNETNSIQACDECNLFETDEDAAHAVDALLTLLGKVYERHPLDTVADSLERIVEALGAARLTGAT